MQRRTFIESTAAAASMAAIQSQTAFGADANGKVRLGVIGCGGRGDWIAGLFKENGGYAVTAVADYFADRTKITGDKHGVDENHRFTGLDCHQKMLASGAVDAVAIISPPYFHPQQAADAVAAGKHVYLAKPAAVDVPGCQSVTQSAEKATKSKLAFLVDFQTRSDPWFMEAMKRVHDGGLGDLCFGEALYHAGRLRPKDTPGESKSEARLRNWVFDKNLSGDIITEQNIHTLDVMSWIMQKPPIRVTGTGGRKVRTDVGDTWDHYALAYEFDDSVGITFSSRQYNAFDTPGGIINRMYGSKGVLLTKYGGDVIIRGTKETFWRGGSSPQIYKTGVTANIKTFHESITKGKINNSTVAPSVQSNLISIMGRKAAYEKRTVTWAELLKDSSTLEADLGGLTG
jgi:predicted dehydrogenase